MLQNILLVFVILSSGVSTYLLEAVFHNGGFEGAVLYAMGLMVAAFAVVLSFSLAVISGQWFFIAIPIIGIPLSILVYNRISMWLEGS